MEFFRGLMQLVRFWFLSAVFHFSVVNLFSEVFDFFQSVKVASRYFLVGTFLVTFCYTLMSRIMRLTRFSPGAQFIFLRKLFLVNSTVRMLLPVISAISRLDKFKERSALTFSSVEDKVGYFFKSFSIITCGTETMLADFVISRVCLNYGIKLVVLKTIKFSQRTEKYC